MYNELTVTTCMSAPRKALTSYSELPGRMTEALSSFSRAPATRQPYTLARYSPQTPNLPSILSSTQRANNRHRCLRQRERCFLLNPGNYFTTIELCIIMNAELPLFGITSCFRIPVNISIVVCFYT